MNGQNNYPNAKKCPSTHYKSWAALAGQRGLFLGIPASPQACQDESGPEGRNRILKKQRINKTTNVHNTLLISPR